MQDLRKNESCALPGCHRILPYLEELSGCNILWNKRKATESLVGFGHQLVGDCRGISTTTAYPRRHEPRGHFVTRTWAWPLSCRPSFSVTPTLRGWRPPGNLPREGRCDHSQTIHGLLRQNGGVKIRRPSQIQLFSVCLHGVLLHAVSGCE